MLLQFTEFSACYAGGTLVVWAALCCSAKFGVAEGYWIDCIF